MMVKGKGFFYFFPINSKRVIYRFSDVFLCRIGNEPRLNKRKHNGYVCFKRAALYSAGVGINSKRDVDGYFQGV